MKIKIFQCDQNSHHSCEEYSSKNLETFHKDINDFLINKIIFSIDFLVNTSPDAACYNLITTCIIKYET